ncbi:histidine phosphatase family protein [filamentous cyanobacterium LEGE 11480]|uniref:Histidine phosphatase family protein n=1 Tax=Romeriopsis navalis LEGE 11480 TaxID=2777977 RepID=A0A928VJJ5_9CYAN|nr:histidine phosphatase family protein [Romeriopsis navalis]MBE9029505.1 histidine phosphatase family protein [Romeriopsis navalis LEGE 11480]
MTTRVIIVRHGESTYNVQRRVQGHLDDQSVLTDKGIAMATQVGAALKGIQFDAAYSSPLKRAFQTAEQILAQLENAPTPTANDHIKEINLPQWEGLTFDEVEQQYPEAYQNWRRNPALLKMQRTDASGNTVDFSPTHDLFDRAKAFWEAVIPESDGKTILIVGHSGINRALITSAIGLGPESYQRIDQSNCCISVLNFQGGFGDNVQLESINVTSHLGEAIPSKRNDQAVRLLLVRHGETQWNREGRFQGQIDIPLNENGKVQGAQAGEFLKDVTIDAAVSSSMSRPKETAELILQHHPQVVLETTDQLWEISHGLWEGKLESEINADYPGLLKEWQTKPEVVQMPEGENLDDVWQRAVKGWDAIAQAAKPGTTTLVVAHDAINKAILCYLAGLPASSFWNFKQGNGAVSVIDYNYGADAAPMIRAANITTHLGGVLDKTAAGAL